MSQDVWRQRCKASIASLMNWIPLFFACEDSQNIGSYLHVPAITISAGCSRPDPSYISPSRQLAAHFNPPQLFATTLRCISVRWLAAGTAGKARSGGIQQQAPFISQRHPTRQRNGPVICGVAVPCSPPRSESHPGASMGLAMMLFGPSGAPWEHP